MPDRPKAAILGAGSTGLAFAPVLASRFGPVDVWEPDPGVGRGAKGTLGVASVSADLARTVAGAAVVVVALPPTNMPSALDAARAELVTGAIVILVGNGQEASHALASGSLPPHASVVCVTIIPGSGPQLASRNRKGDDPRALSHAFAAAGISPGTGAHPDAVGVVQALVEGVGAKPFFGEAREIDALAAAALALPSIVAAATVSTTIGATSSRDLDRAGGAALASVTDVLERHPLGIDDIAALSEHVTRLIDQLVLHLLETRDALASGTPDPAGLEDATVRRRKWVAARGVLPEDADLPDVPSPSRRRLFF